MNKNSGFTLVEVMIASGVAMVLILAVTEMTVNSGRSARSVQVNADWTGLMSSMQALMNNEAACAAALGNANPPLGNYTGAAIQIPTLAIGTSPIASTLTQVTPGLVVTGMQIDNAQGAFTNYPDNAGHMTWRKWMTSITIKATKALPGGVAVGGNTLFQNTPPLFLNVITDTGGVIKDCFGQASASGDCAALGGSYNFSSNPPCQIPGTPRNCGTLANTFRVVGNNGGAGNGSFSQTLWCDGSLSGSPNNGAVATPPATLKNKIAIAGGMMCLNDNSNGGWNTGNHLTGALPDVSGMGWVGNCQGTGNATFAMTVICCDD